MSVKEQIERRKKEREREEIIEGYLREYLESKGFKLSKIDYIWGVGWLLPIKSKGELTNEYIKFFNEMRKKGVWKKKDSKWWNLDNLFKGRFDYNFSVEGEITIDKRELYSWLRKKASGGEKDCWDKCKTCETSACSECPDSKPFESEFDKACKRWFKKEKPPEPKFDCEGICGFCDIKDTCNNPKRFKQRKASEERVRDATRNEPRENEIWLKLI